MGELQAFDPQMGDNQAHTQLPECMSSFHVIFADVELISSLKIFL